MTIGLSSIKQRLLTSTFTSLPLHVGQGVPFYFCRRSIMLYLIYKGNHPELGKTRANLLVSRAALLLLRGALP